MKQMIRRLLPVAAAIVLGMAFASVLLCYTRTMEAQVYDLSVIAPDGATEWQGDMGWRFYSKEAGRETELVPDGWGGYSGLSYPGQTFYYSRVLNETLDSPKLQIGAVNRNIAVFLDEELVYTDCPELDNRIGYLHLPMLGWDRQEPVQVSLPPDYRGRTLTVAQSTPILSEREDGRIDEVYPCDVILYCGYSYESELIAQTAQTVIPAGILFAFGIFLLGLLIWQSLHNRPDIGLLCFALVAFLWVAEHIVQAPFFYQYFGVPVVDPGTLSRNLSVGALVAFLASRAERFRLPMWVVAAAQMAVSLLGAAVQASGYQSDVSVFLVGFFPQQVGFFALVLALSAGVVEWRRGNRFFRLFLPLSLGCLLGYLGIMLVYHIYLDDLAQAFARLRYMVWPDFVLWKLEATVLPAAFVAMCVSLVEQEMRLRLELSLLEERNEMAEASYKNLQSQSEQVMMLRHDMTKHMTLLRSMIGDKSPQAVDYLDELIGQEKAIRSVVRSGNDVLDTILNGKLGPAVDLGIRVEVVRSQAPGHLPLSDAELCSLVMNIIDNAVAAAGAPGVEEPYIRLDMHIKNGFFVFACENAALKTTQEKDNTKKTVPRHGLGLKIIRQVAGRWGNLLKTEWGEHSYKVTIAIPLN